VNFKICISFLSFCGAFIGHHFLFLSQNSEQLNTLNLYDQGKNNYKQVLQYRPWFLTERDFKMFFQSVAFFQRKQRWKILFQKIKLWKFPRNEVILHVWQNSPFQICVYAGIEEHALKNVNNFLNSNIYSYLETSGGQSFNPYLNVVHFFNTRVDKKSVPA
jgi:hypothetical protein